jgi:hypothetical protein
VISVVVVVLIGAVAFAVSDAVRFVVCSAAQFSIYGMPQQQDVHEAEAITNVITTVHHFAQNSVSQPDRPPVFSNAGSRMLLTQPTEIEVYGVTDRAEQDKVIAAVKNALQRGKRKPVDLRFMDHENWIVYGNMGERGPELQLRRVHVTQNGVREEGVQKTITYPVP